MSCLSFESGPCPPLRKLCLSLDTAPCPPPFVENIYDIFVALAVNQSLSTEEYTAIAMKCNILPSTTTSGTSSPESSTTVTSFESSTPTDVPTSLSITPSSNKQSTTSSLTSSTTESTKTTSGSSSLKSSTPTETLYTILSMSSSNKQSTTSSLTSSTSNPSTDAINTTLSTMSSSNKQSTTSTVTSISTEATVTTAEPSSFKSSTPTMEIESTTSSSIKETTKTLTSESSMTESTFESSIITTTTDEGTTRSSTMTTPKESTMSSVEITTSRETPVETSESSATYSASLKSTSLVVTTYSTESYVVTSDSSKTVSTSTSSIATTETESLSSTSVISSTEPTGTSVLSTTESTSEVHITTRETESPSSSANNLITTSESSMTDSSSKSSLTTATKIETTRPTTQITITSSVESSGSSTDPGSSTDKAETIKTTLAPTFITKDFTQTSSSVQSSSSSSNPASTVTTSRASSTTAVPSVTTRELYSSTVSVHNTTMEPGILTTDPSRRSQQTVIAANSCNAVCQITLGCCVSLLVALCILTFIFLKIHQARKHRKVRFRSHQYGKTYPATRLYDNVMNGSFRASSWNFYKGHSRSSSETSFVYAHEPLRFVNQIYLPDTALVSDISETDRHTSKHYLKRSTSSEVRRTTKPKVSQSLSFDSYSSNRVDKSSRDSLYKKNSRPSRSSVQRKGHRSGHTRSRSMGNPYSMEEYDSGSSFDSNGPIPYDGPITFTPELSRRPFQKIPSELRREMIEQTRDSRRDLNDDQSRRRSRSHDPSLVTRGYIERQFSFDLDPDCPDYRPLGRYKKHNPRVRKVSSVSREFNMDNINRYASELELENSYLSSDVVNGNLPHNANTNSIRNRNKEQKVINSILKKNKPPNNRSRSDCTDEGSRNDESAVDVFTPSRDRSQSYGATLDNTVNAQKPNTIYFYQTRL